MVADPRQRVAMFLRREFEIMRLEILQDRRLVAEEFLARTNYTIATTLAAKTRSRIVRLLPGCTIGFRVQELVITLPDGYPDKYRHLTERIPVHLINYFTPPAMREDLAKDAG